MYKTPLIIFVVLLNLFACDNETNNINICEQVTIVSSELYENAPNHLLTINSLEINENCLKINFSSSGCDGDTWDLKLIDSEAILESLPPQRNVRLSLKNEEVCLAYVTKELTFDITPLKLDGNQVLLNITNANKQILYEY